MTFARTKIFIACLLATGLGLSACSNSNNSDKKQDTLTASAPATGEASNLSERNAQQRLISTLEGHFKKAGINAKITGIKTTEVPNMSWVSLEGMAPVYVTNDGKYLIQGDVIRLGDKELHNVSETLQSDVNKKIFANLKAEDLLIYPAKGKTKHVIYVFTDVSCPYCHKFHEQMDEMNSKGIEVRYIAWPRGEQHMPAMEAIWCNSDRRAAFDQAIAGGSITPTTCKNPVKDQYQMGLNIGVNGTPGVYSSEGLYLGGYMSTSELLDRLK
ncbi:MULTISPECIES: DsbC family protein [Acinetobacter]|jgi:Protein-disulfide isomerase|uniref:Thiol:disulfide interchange protein n=1 Tax=Acinetobacter variabilis TaxID=70346 RepID=A0A7T8ARM9_9GAMM|nr:MULTISPECIES: DsbC family protein [Acinetobacter]EXA66613.1 thioredoxin family protein [Acinetobacter baumannii 348935]HAB43989.1 DsbC family protein [Acinetobacter sp.]AUX91139.1 DsbC family protein [Acinetobacter sp. ACNIH1]NHB64168.1 DsbC family protein [Acinetobacter sp. GFQ9D191M]NHC00019.1 DsbC family protein [Acinetobacter sp. GFQ9D192M]